MNVVDLCELVFVCLGIVEITEKEFLLSVCRDFDELIQIFSKLPCLAAAYKL